MPAPAIREISVEETYPLRHIVLRPGQPPESYHFPADHERDTFHLGAVIGTEVVSIATFLRRSHELFEIGSQYQLRGMATHPAFRGRGLGAAIIRSGLQLLQERSVELLWCNARVPACEFYLKSGFHVNGEQFEIPLSGPHLVMWRAIAERVK